MKMKTPSSRKKIAPKGDGLPDFGCDAEETAIGFGGTDVIYTPQEVARREAVERLARRMFAEGMRYVMNKRAFGDKVVLHYEADRIEEGKS